MEAIRWPSHSDQIIKVMELPEFQEVFPNARDLESKTKTWEVTETDRKISS